MSDAKPVQETLPELVGRYLTDREGSVEELLVGMRGVEWARPGLRGWMLAECQMLDSSYLGSRVLLPFGPGCTFAAPPEGPFTPRGLASDTSVVVAWTNETVGGLARAERRAAEPQA